MGDHFEAGQPLFIIEVMKMFNKVLAPFAGTVVERPDGATATARWCRRARRSSAIEPDVRVEPESRVRARRARARGDAGAALTRMSRVSPDPWRRARRVALGCLAAASLAAFATAAAEPQAAPKRPPSRQLIARGTFSNTYSAARCRP